MTVITCLIVVPLAYVFARLEFPMKSKLLAAVLLSVSLPPVSTLIPFYSLYVQLNLIGTLTGLIIITLTITIPLVVWMLIGFFRNLPPIENLGRIDGFSRIYIFARIVVPMARSGVIVAAVIAFLFSWNEYVYAQVLVTGSNAVTLPAAMTGFLFQVPEPAQLAASLAVSLVPPFIIAFFHPEAHRGNESFRPRAIELGPLRMSRIVLRDIQKSFGVHHAVHSLNMTIDDGELLVLLGPSGCGKSTTMNMIAGLMQPTSGTILFDDKDVTEASPHDRNIAMVFQSSLLYPHMTARENIAMSLKRSGLAKAEIGRRVADAAATVDVVRLLDKLPGQLSGGERQRVATAKAIVRQPTCFLLDEPLAALDAALRLTLRSELVNLQKRLKTTMIFVTHDQVEAMTMGDRIGVMRHGQLEQIGTPNDIYNEPESLFVAGFVGSPPMNFLKGQITEVNGSAVFANAFVTMPLGSRANGATANKPVVLAVRPQRMSLGEAGPDAIPLVVYALEHLGSESVVIADAPDKSKLRAVVPAGFEARIGEVLHARFDAAHSRLFDAETERVLKPN